MKDKDTPWSFRYEDNAYGGKTLFMGWGCILIPILVFLAFILISTRF